MSANGKTGKEVSGGQSHFWQVLKIPKIRWKPWQEINEPASGEDGIGKWNLFPLRPIYKAKDHSPYVDAIEDCLHIKDIHNIALTGNYGVGKSSILSEVAARHSNTVVQISLSTLAPISPGEVDDSIPKQATTTTNRIQQEIVKQLLYSEKPKDMPESRFKRIGRPSWLRQSIIALYGGFLCLLVLLATGWYKNILASFSLSLGPAGYLYAFLVGCVLSFGLITMFHGRIHLRQFSAGPATVTLDDQSVSFFDQYLDEIMYYFEKSHRTIVIFEDLDRFNDSNIFETLRALNTLLNSSKERKSRPVRFIYALKDSVFDKESLEKEKENTREGLTEDITDLDDPAKAESIRANRTKFFDIVIPVVPFISHTTAGSLILQLLGETDSHVSPWIADLAGRYVTDMRLLKNICNEFTIFHDRLNAGDGVELNFNDDQIFAMMLYKNTSMREFELLRIGKSNIDHLYADYRRLVSQNVRRLQQEIRTLEQQKTQINQVSERSEKLGGRLLDFLGLQSKSLGYDNPRFDIRFNNRIFSGENVNSEAFWAALVKLSDKEQISVNVQENYRSQTRLQFNISGISQITGASLKESMWEPERLEALSAGIDQNQQQIDFLRSADMSNLISRPEFLLDQVATMEESVGAGARETASGQSLESIAKEHLKDGLTYELVKKGAINRNYALYAQIFYGNRVSAAATNFIHHQIEPNEMDTQLALSDRDVADVLRENSSTNLGERAFYNVSIFDYILNKYFVRNHSEKMEALPGGDKLIDAVSTLGNDESDFLQSYYESGRNNAKDALIPLMLERNTDILDYFVSKIALNEDDRGHWVNIALQNIKVDQDYDIGEDSSLYLRDQLNDLSVLKQDDTPPDVAAAISGILEKAGAVAADLSNFAGVFIRGLVVRNMYEINHANLITITESTDVSLDCLKSVKPESVYENVLAHLSEYLSALNSDDHTVEKPAILAEVLNDIAKREDFDKDLVERVIARSADDCKVTVLADIDNDDIKDELVKQSKIVLSYANVILYISVSDGVNQALADMLNAQRDIVDIPKGEESLADRKELANDIINADSDLLSVSRKIQLIEDVDLETTLDVDEMSVQEGDLFAELIRHNIIPDDKTTFEHIDEAQWPTREKAIAESKHFITFMDEDVVHPNELQQLIQSELISEDIKNKVLDDFSLYTAKADKTNMEAVAKFTIEQRRGLGFDNFSTLFGADIGASIIVELVCLSTANLSMDQVHTILGQLSGEYRQLSVRGLDRPKLSDTPENFELVKYLKDNGKIVTSFAQKDGAIIVSKHHQ